MLKPNQVEHISIALDDVERGLVLQIYPENKALCFILPSSIAAEYNESQYQILEGNTYEYEFNKNEYSLACSNNEIVNTSRFNTHRGRLCPNIFVGKLQLSIVHTPTRQAVNTLYIEVLATKFNTQLDKSYRHNYRKMLEDITERCTDILMQINAPIVQSFTINYNRNSNNLYQRFSFVNSLINNVDFEQAIWQIVKHPSTHWKSVSGKSPIQNIKKIDRGMIRQITSSNNRTAASNQSLQALNIQSLPQKLNLQQKVESFDTAENRFIKHALETFLKFADDCALIFKNSNLTLPHSEAIHLTQKLSECLNFPLFKEIRKADRFKLNSPLLQKRAGYRELLNRWLQFDLAAQLIWKGGDDVYQAGKKDIATLYEYWLFFILYDLIKDKFGYTYQTTKEAPYGHLIQVDKDGLNLRLKAGKHILFSGICHRYQRDLGFRFSYNRSFRGNSKYDGKEGSWTSSMRPDYTISFWPASFTEEQAEREDAIVHIHFDAKYKIQNFNDEIILDTGEQTNKDQESELLTKQKQDERKGTYKNIDLLKMHAYKDAIRRTGGAYILYPGKNSTVYQGFHEIIPGLGAFSINPSQNHSGVKELSEFIDEVIQNLLDRTSQREQIAIKNKDILSESRVTYKPTTFRYPSYFDLNKINPMESKVLVAYYKTENWDWIQKNRLLNLRINTDRGSLRIQDFDYILLHTISEVVTSKFYRIADKGPKILSKESLIKKGYPSVPSQHHYLVYPLEDILDTEFAGLRFDIRDLKDYKTGRASAIPFTSTLYELMENAINKNDEEL